MRMRYLGTLAASVGVLIGLAVAPPAAAAAASGTMVFTQPTGSVASTDTIDIQLTISLDHTAAPLMTDGSGNVISGVSNADLIAAGIDPTMVASSDITDGFPCSGTFTSGCTNGPPYNFSFAPGIAFQSNLDLEPDSVTQFDFGTLTPSNGPVPYGTYVFPDANVFAQFYDAQGTHLGDVDLFDTCVTGDASCSFTRTVDSGPIAGGGVPEPASWALMIGGFGLAGAALRRRRGVIAYPASR
jgi:PEP-CTERM motif